MKKSYSSNQNHVRGGSSTYHRSPQQPRLQQQQQRHPILKTSRIHGGLTPTTTSSGHVDHPQYTHYLPVANHFNRHLAHQPIAPTSSGVFANVTSSSMTSTTTNNANIHRSVVGGDSGHSSSKEDDLCQLFNSLNVNVNNTSSKIQTSPVEMNEKKTSPLQISVNKDTFGFSDLISEEEFDMDKIHELEKMEHQEMRSTSESSDAKKAIEVRGHEFSKRYLDQQGTMILRPLAGETVEEALLAMMKICTGALENGGSNWKSIVQKKDKYNLLSEARHKKKILMKTVYTQAVLTVVRNTLKENRPPAMLNSCKLGRELVISWIGVEDAKKCWIPHYGTIYTWFWDFTNGRQFDHPELKTHEKQEMLDGLDSLFKMYPNKLILLKDHIRRVKFERGSDSLIDIGYETYRFFVEKIASGSISPVSGATSSSCGVSMTDPGIASSVGSMNGGAAVADLISSSSQIGQENTNTQNSMEGDLISNFHLAGLKWTTLYDWMNKHNL